MAIGYESFDRAVLAAKTFEARLVCCGKLEPLGAYATFNCGRASDPCYPKDSSSVAELDQLANILAEKLSTRPKSTRPLGIFQFDGEKRE